MSCVSPVTIRVPHIRYNGEKYFQTFEVPCNNCINCLIKKQSQLEFLGSKELLDVYQSGRGASFVTLTYDDNHIPCNSNGLVTLRKSDLQKWLKNLRRQQEYYNEKVPFKYVACGEYGDELGRPHYHIVFLGLTDVQVAKYTKKLWKHGLCDIGPLGQGGLRYVLKYLTKAHPTKDVKNMRLSLDVENPFVTHSFGLGKNWIIRHVNDIADSNFIFNINGKDYLYPKYVMRYVSLRTGKSYKKAVRDFLFKTVIPESRAKDKMANILLKERSFIQFENNLASLRSKNIPIDPAILAQKKWLKPKSYHDRFLVKKKIDNLVDFAIYGDVVPF